MATKVMVNGATGLLGMEIVKEFHNAGEYEVRASDRPGSNFTELEKLGVEIVPAEITNQAEVEKTVEGMDIVINVAGIFDYRVSKKVLDNVNHLGVRTICSACLKKAPNLKKFLQISTVGVYGPPVRSPCREDDPKNPRNNYEKTKFLGELAAFEFYKNHKLPVCAIRPTLIYGPKSKYGHAMFIGLLSLLKANGRDKVLAIKGGPKTHHINVRDVAKSARLVAERNDTIGEVYNVADLNPLDGESFIRALAEPLGLEVKANIYYFAPSAKVIELFGLRVPIALFDRLNKRIERNWKKLVEKYSLKDELRPRLDRDWIGYASKDHVYDITKLKKLGFNWEYPDFKEGIKETIKWYKDNRWIP